MDGEELGWDDDGGADTDSRLVAALPADGEYEVLIGAFDDGRGSYTVKVEPLAIGFLEIGESVDGVLGADDGVWRFRGETGKTVVVSAVSDAFDTIVELRAGDGDELGRDDDGGTGTGSRLLATLAGDGDYEVRVISNGEGVGAYRLWVREADVGFVELDTVVVGVVGADDGVWHFSGEAGRRS